MTTGVDTAYATTGSEVRLTAASADGDRDHQVVVRGYAAGGYPTLGLHMSVNDAIRLSAELLDAVEASRIRREVSAA